MSCVPFVQWLFYTLSLQMVQTERYQKELVAGPGFNTCDTYALAAAIDDTLVTESEQVQRLISSFTNHVHSCLVPDI